jgi:hypothetical protein
VIGQNVKVRYVGRGCWSSWVGVILEYFVEFRVIRISFCGWGMKAV